MARTVIISVALSLMVLTVSCQTASPDSAFREPRRTVYAPTAAISDVNSSTDALALVEQVTKYRQAYRQSLSLLVDHYTSAGDNRRLAWAKEELQALDRMPQYRYIVDPSTFPEDLKATAKIMDADKIYFDAVKTQQEAEALGPVLKNEEMLRVALSKYADLIRQYPTSDKIDDAAWRSAGIQEWFKNYDTAIMFYKRTFQWDPSTSYAARYNAALLLDKMGRRDEALPLYQEAVAKEAKHIANTANAERRIKELTAPKQ
jgi:tetratricopeptide (TPR) repeat protein